MSFIKDLGVVLSLCAAIGVTLPEMAQAARLRAGGVHRSSGYVFPFPAATFAGPDDSYFISEFVDLEVRQDRSRRYRQRVTRVDFSGRVLAQWSVAALPEEGGFDRTLGFIPFSAHSGLLGVVLGRATAIAHGEVVLLDKDLREHGRVSLLRSDFPIAESRGMLGLADDGAFDQEGCFLLPLDRQYEIEFARFCQRDHLGWHIDRTTRAPGSVHEDNLVRTAMKGGQRIAEKFLRGMSFLTQAADPRVSGVHLVNASGVPVATLVASAAEMRGGLGVHLSSESIFAANTSPVDPSRIAQLRVWSPSGVTLYSESEESGLPWVQEKTIVFNSGGGIVLRPSDDREQVRFVSADGVVRDAAPHRWASRRLLRSAQFLRLSNMRVLLERRGEGSRDALWALSLSDDGRIASEARLGGWVPKDWEPDLIRVEGNDGVRTLWVWDHGRMRSYDLGRGFGDSVPGGSWSCAYMNGEREALGWPATTFLCPGGYPGTGITHRVVTVR